MHWIMQNFIPGWGTGAVHRELGLTSVIDRDQAAKQPVTLNVVASVQRAKSAAGVPLTKRRPLQRTGGPTRPCRTIVAIDAIDAIAPRRAAPGEFRNNDDADDPAAPAENAGPPWETEPEPPAP